MVCQGLAFSHPEIEKSFTIARDCAHAHADSAPDRVREGTISASGSRCRSATSACPTRRWTPHRGRRAALGRRARHPRPSLSARRSDQVRRLHRRFVQARPPGQQASRRRIHRLLRRALHGRKRRRAQRRPSTGDSAGPRRRLFDGRHGRPRPARTVLERSRADGRFRRSSPSPISTRRRRSKRSAANTAASSAPRRMPRRR